jgi:uncharacterized UPF0160 family protein
MDAPEPWFSTFHGVWEAVLSALGGVLVFFVKQVKTAIDEKADKKDVETKFEDVQSSINRVLDNQDHNSRRLDAILLNLTSRRDL